MYTIVCEKFGVKKFLLVVWHNKNKMHEIFFSNDYFVYIPYSGKAWREKSLANLANSSWFAKLKPSKLVLTINNLLCDLLIHQTFFCQMLEESVYQTCPYQTFPLYGIWIVDIIITGTIGIIGLWHGNKLIKNNG